MKVRRLVLGFIACLFASPASAQVNPFEFKVYPYETVEPDSLETEWLNDFVPDGHHAGPNGTSLGTYPSDLMYRTTLEVATGLSEKVEGAAYLALAHPNVASFQYAGSFYELRGRLFERDELPVNIGWLAELDWWRTPEFNKDQLGIDLMPILEKSFGPVVVTLNPIFDKALVGHGSNQGFEFGYANKISWLLTPYFAPGLEFYGGAGLINDTDPITAQQHYIFPVIDLELPGKLHANFGAGFGLTRGSDRVITKLNLQMEQFVGQMF